MISEAKIPWLSFCDGGSHKVIASINKAKTSLSISYINQPTDLQILCNYMVKSIILLYANLFFHPLKKNDISMSQSF